jgi:Family of unknown function (DUF5995)
MLRDRLRMIGLSLVWVAIGSACLVSPAVGYTPPPVVPWETLLPPLPTTRNPHFTGVPGCGRATMRCLDTEVRRMDALRRRLGCDHRAVFTTTYELLTEVLRASMRAHPHLFRDPKWVIGEDATFADLYFTAVSNYERGKPLPQAWLIAFGAARQGDDNAVQDMLLGINAHVQRDMPYMLASVGLRAQNGTSHKHDHDVFNEVLNRAYPFVVDTITQRFDPIEGLIAPRYNPMLGFTGNITGDQLVQTWREQVWRNAELLLDAPDTAVRQLVEANIETNAATWARLIATPQFQPGYRAVRDAYCRAHNRGPLPPVKGISPAQ